VERIERVNKKMDSMLIVQISFYFIVFVVVVVGLFALFKGIMRFVMRVPRQPKLSKRFIPHEPPMIAQGMEEVTLSQISNIPPPSAFVGDEKQLSGAVCRVTGKLVVDCKRDCCRGKSGKVKH
jgi:hypothetical protein